jgi:SP family general alpha glucoside:H+ symporter-like MFS transporter
MLLLIVWMLYRLPKAKALSTETLNHLFHERVPARGFGVEKGRFQY